MDTNKLHHFRILAEVQNLRRASELLGMSHSGLLKSVKALETELNLDLFVKDGRESRLTEQGKLLLRESRGILEAEKNLKSVLDGKMNPKKKKITIATFEVFSTYLAPTLINSLQSDSAEINFIEAGPGNMERIVLNGDADIAISYSPIPMAGVEHVRVATIENRIYVKNESALKKLELDILPFVVPSNDLIDTPTREKGLDGWPEDKYKRNVAYKVSMMETALSLCREGMAAGFFPDFVIKLHNSHLKKESQLVTHKAGIVAKQNVYLIKRMNQIENSEMKRIAKVLRSI